MMNKEKPLVSIIVPVYKAEKYLARCINSIQAQSYKETEIILVDDSSPDRCPEICDEYAAKYNNIQTIHLKDTSFGASDARNAGLNKAKGEFIAFIDSDDYVHPDLLSVLMKSFEDSAKIKLSICSYERVYELKSHSPVSTNNEYKLFDESQTMDLLVTDQTQSALWGKVFSKELFEGLSFKPGKHNEDMFIMPSLIFRAKKVTYSAQPLYYYFQDSESLCRSKFNYHMLDMIEALSEWRNHIENKFPNLVEKINGRYFSTVIDMCQYLSQIDENTAAMHYNKYIDELKLNIGNILNSRYISATNKFKILLIKISVFKLAINSFQFFGRRSYR